MNTCVKLLEHRSGFALLGALFCVTLLVIFLFWASSSFLKAKNQELIAMDKGVALGYASELLELFISMTNSQLVAYLSRTPNAMNPYLLCAHINIIDRTAGSSSSTLINPDPVAELGTTNVLPMNVNRFYQVIVMDRGTLTPKPNACGLTAALGDNATNCGVQGGQYLLCGDERLQVTVGVSFSQRSYGPNPSGIFDRVALSSMLLNI